jgi:uncharacterized membrane protein YjgN (DUF898 family)
VDLTPDNVVQAEIADGTAAVELSTGQTRERFTFHGSGGEYFRIWIVNLLLTILTLGIYSAWAKVRRNRYIYGNLELAGSRLDYLAKPLVILRGRLIALALLAAVFAAQSLLPVLYIGSFLLLGLVTPWLIVRARMFNMRYTSYRNIRFGFKPAYGESYKTIMLYGLAAVLTLGLAAPYSHYKRDSFVIGNTRFGNLDFRLGTVANKFYLAYFLGIGLGVLLIAPVSGLLAQFSLSARNPAADPGSMLSILSLAPAVAALLFYYVVGKFTASYILRIATNNTTIGTDVDSGQCHRLGCDWSLPGMLWIYLSNVVAIAFSLGLLTPWAQMRILKYQLDHTWLDIEGDLNSVVAVQEQAVSSLGEEIGDVFDVDIGL